jgi:hypothetical protein
MRSGLAAGLYAPHVPGPCPPPCGDPQAPSLRASSPAAEPESQLMVRPGITGPTMVSGTIDPVFSLREWWDNAGRVTEQKAARASEVARQRAAAEINRLRALSDDELIADSPARTSLSRADHEMEMQRRLRDAILAQIAESRKGRIWAAWGAAAIAALTVVLIVLTVVLIKRG